MTFPATKDTNSDPAGSTYVDAGIDHALLHTNINNTVEGIQDNIGTNSGTSVLKNFVAGDFAVRMDTGGTLQQVVSGTANNSTLGTPAITGGTYNNPTIGTPIASNGTYTSGVFNTPSLGGSVTNSGTVPMCKIYKGTAQPINTASDTLINFASEEFDTDGMHDNVTANTRITIKTAGLYLVGFTCNYGTSNITGRRVASLQINGAYNANGISAEVSNGVTDQQIRLYSSGLLSLNVNDYIEMSCYQSSGGTINVDGGGNASERTTLWAYKLGGTTPVT